MKLTEKVDAELAELPSFSTNLKARKPRDDHSVAETECSSANGINDNEKAEKYEIAYNGERIDPWSKSYLGVPLNYFSVGLMLGGSVSILYPVLVVREGVTSSLLAASNSLVTIFWSYKIFFGFISDCFPIFGWKRKPYIFTGWVLCATLLFTLASEGHEIIPSRLVIMLTLANLGYVMADVSADGFMVWMAHREPVNERGKTQTLVYSINTIGQIVINIVVLLGFSGPEMNCPGYQSDPNIPCTSNEHTLTRNQLSLVDPENWCHQMCDNAVFDFNITIPQFAILIAVVNVISLPSFCMLHEEKVQKQSVNEFITKFWVQLQRKAIWQVMLYSMVSHITLGVVNAAKVPANYVWLNLHTTQNQIMVLMEKVITFVSLSYVRKYALHISWRKLVWNGSILVTFFNLLYFIIAFNLWRNVWFYIFTDVTEKFMHTLNFIASVFCMVEVAEPGYEAITYALITTASNAVSPLSAVISYQFLAFFPDLNTQQSIATDTPEVRKHFAMLHTMTMIVNLSSLLALPMLPRQKKETRELVMKGEKSSFWVRSCYECILFFTCSSMEVINNVQFVFCFDLLLDRGDLPFGPCLFFWPTQPLSHFLQS